jgi:hypothetical protein
LPIKYEVSLYTSETFPRKLEMNTTGSTILHGWNDAELVSGRIDLNRLQIREVSSHYQNGWLYLVIMPKANQNSSLQSDLDISEVKPLIIDKIVVKAKNLKKE